LLRRGQLSDAPAHLRERGNDLRRVVVTGMGGVTALGEDWPTIRASMAAGRTAIRAMQDWDRYAGINTRLGAPIPSFSVGHRYPRKTLRSMGPVAQMAVYAAERALTDAGLRHDKIVTSGRLGVAFGSSFGSPDAVLGFYELKRHGSSRHLTAS